MSPVPYPPREPPPSRWALTAPGPGHDDDLVALGGDLAPGTLLEAYRHGLFPMGTGQHGAPPIGWWCPIERGVLPLEGLRVSRSLRRSARHYTTTLDTAFDEVVRACADVSREGRWITEEVVDAYRRLHELGWAHSVEVWTPGPHRRLAGGLYGLGVGGLFAGESMFHRGRDASKVALLRLVEVLRADGDRRRLLDVQWSTPHLASLGVVTVPREAYLDRLEEALEADDPQWS